MRSLSPDQFLGCLFGCAVGDALGAPFTDGDLLASLPADPADLAYTRMPGYPLGQYTDDTQMTLALANSICTKGEIDGADMAQALCQLWRNGEILDARPSCTEAMDRLEADKEGWEHSGSETVDLSSAARVGPIALWRATDSRTLVADVSTNNYITHASEVACGAAVSVARAIAFVAAHEEIVAERCLYRIGTAASFVAPEFGEWIPLVGEALQEDEIDARARLTVENDNGPIFSLLWALYAALRTPNDFLAALHTAIKLGGEPDAMGAIAGSIVGAHGGLAVIPKSLVDGLWNKQVVRNTAEALAARYAAVVGDEVPKS